MLSVNEHSCPYRDGQTLIELAKKFQPDADIFIINGFPTSADVTVKDGDTISLICRGKQPTKAEIDSLLSARHTPGIQKVIKQSTIAILGLGGLGSAVAGAMAKIGIGKMLLSDYDVVEPSNLNRQHYFVDQIGMPKTRALHDNLLRMNPSVSLELVEKQLVADDLPVYFGKVDVLIECFDDPAMKAVALRSILGTMKKVAYVGSSGMAGFGSNNTIRTQTIHPGIYLVGDGVSGAQPGQGLMAPRVGIAAHHQANQTLRIILGEVERRADIE